LLIVVRRDPLGDRPLEGCDDEDRPNYAMVSYVWAADRLDNSDLVLGRDYSGQYEAPIWRDDT
jgi:hypothetical protein